MLQFILVSSAISALVAVGSVHALRNALQDGAGNAAQNTTDAGVAEAISYIRSNSLLSLTCAEPLTPTSTAWQTATGCTSAGWANPTHPVTVGGGSILTSGASCPANQDCFKVYIGTVRPYASPQGPAGGASSTPAVPALLRIHSVGLSGAGPGGRSIQVDVSVKPTRFPFGVFGNSFSMPASHSPAGNESIFTTGNVSLKCPLSGIDYQNNIPAAVHAAGTLTYSNGSCHPPSNPTATCNLSTPYDQDSHGISFAGTPCLNYDLTDPAFATTGVTAYSSGSFFDGNGLAAYGYRPGGLSPTEYDQLKSEAQAMGTYNNNANLGTVIAQLVARGVTNPVVYSDDGSTPSPSAFPSGFFRDPTSTNCPAFAAVIVVRGGGSLHWTQTGGASMVASIFMPDPGATFAMTGLASVIGTVFAENLDLNGNGFLELDPCFVNSPPGGVLDVTTTNFRVIDTTNVQ